MIVFDLETRGFSDEIILGGMYNGLEYHEFDNVIDFLDLCTKRNDEEIVYSHNGGRFDNRILYHYFKKQGIRMFGYLNINGALLYHVQYKNCTLHFRDSFLLMDTSLEKLTQTFDVKYKKKSDFNMEKWLEDGCPITPKLREYLKYDVLGLWNVIRKFERSIDCKLELTMASTSFSDLLQTDSGVDGKTVEKVTRNYLSKENENKIREAYRGGRTEVFQRTCRGATYYDVNSLYPAAMMRPMPIGKYSACEGKSAQLYFEFGFEGVSLAHVHCPENLVIPYLGIHTDKKLVFPVGRFEDWYTNFELREAQKRGYSVTIIEGIFYDTTARIFENFVNKHRRRKEKAENATERYLAKKFLNTAYGKWGQRREHQQIVNIDEFYKIPDNCLSEQLNEDLITYPYENYSNRKINPIYATYITAYARHMLYEGFEQLGFENIIYCDTDSIVATAELPDSMVDPHEFGKWDIEHMIDYGVFVAPKLYAMKIKNSSEVIRKIKGVSKKQMCNLGLIDFMRVIFQEKEFELEGSRLCGFLEKYRRTDCRNDDRQIIEINANKTVSDSFEKRILKEDKIHTQPYKLS